MIFRGDSEFISQHRTQNFPLCQLWQPFHGFPSGGAHPLLWNEDHQGFNQNSLIWDHPTNFHLVEALPAPYTGIPEPPWDMEQVLKGGKKMSMHFWEGVSGCAAGFAFPLERNAGLCLPRGQGLR